MKKAVIAAIAVVVIAGGSAIAYEAYARHDGWGHGRHHARMSADDMSAYADARIAALKAGLRLTGEQEPLWAPVEETLKELAARRMERREERRADRRERREERRAERRDGDRERAAQRNPVERLRSHAERMSERGAGLKRLADATEPLYASLDDAQKRRFNRLARAGMRDMHRPVRHDRKRDWHRHGHFDEGNRFERFRRDDDRRRDLRQRIEWTAPLPQQAERL